MPISRYFSVVGSILLALLFVSDAYFGESEPRFDGSFYQSATYAPLLETPIATERQFTHDVTPAARIREVFSQFGANEGKRGRRYSSLDTVIR
jgi:hypothetical protein